MRSIVGLSCGLLALTLTACTQDPHAMGVSLGEGHAEALRKHDITLERLDEEIERAEVRLEGQDLNAFRKGYEGAIEPAKDELADLYVRTAAEELERAGGRLGQKIGGWAKGLVEAVEEGVEDINADGSKARMKDVGRHLGRIVKGLESAVEAAANGFEEEMEERRK